jgi:hypothetical protein
MHFTEPAYSCWDPDWGSNWKLVLSFNKLHSVSYAMWMLIAWLGLLHSSSVVRWPNICVMLCRMKACTQWGWMEAMSTEEFNLAIYMQLWKYMHLCEPSVGIKGVKRDSSVWKYTHLWVWCQTLDSFDIKPYYQFEFQPFDIPSAQTENQNWKWTFSQVTIFFWTVNYVNLYQ